MASIGDGGMRSMEIRGEEVLLPVSAVSAYPRPHWLQGRVFGSLHEPTWRSQGLRVAYEDACKICSREQENAGLHVLTDGVQYYDWEAPGYQLEPIFHYITENLGGCAPYGPPGQGVKYRPFYQSVIKSKITWARPSRALSSRTSTTVTRWRWPGTLRWR